MAAIFVSNPGEVVSYKNIGALPLSIFVENWPGYPSIRAIITGVSGSSSGNFNVTHTLQDFIYVYIFGERIGDLMISGLAFAGLGCGTSNQTGIEQIADFYNKYRISAYGKLLNIQIGLSGSSSLRGFLVGFQPDITNAESQVSQFGLTFKTFSPEANK